MDTNESRLNTAAPCGVIRDGHQMTLVRLDDLQALCGAYMMRERELALTDETVKHLKAYNADLEAESVKMRAAMLSAIHTLENPLP